MSLCMCAFQSQAPCLAVNHPIVLAVSYRSSTVVHVVQVLQDRSTCSSTEYAVEEKLRPLAQSWKCMEEGKQTLCTQMFL